jgi:hypothetical protein
VSSINEKELACQAFWLDYLKIRVTTGQSHLICYIEKLSTPLYFSCFGNYSGECTQKGKSWVN